MNCDRIKELLVTDYVDGELDEARKEEVREHLSTCGACREYERIVRKAVVEPFKNIEKPTPPDSVWNRIKETITAEKGRRTEGVFTGLKERLCITFPSRVPAFAAAVVIIILLAAVFTGLSFNNQRIVNDYLDEQVEFLAELSADTAGFAETAEMDLGTSIEEMLL